MTDDRWTEIWEGRRAPDDAPSLLQGLMAADGLDTKLGSVGVDAWSAFVREVASRLGVQPGERVFEFGCGAGAFLYELDRLGMRVAGVDRSASLVEEARKAIPRGHFAVGDAADLPAGERADFAVSCGVFLYFPSLAYAERVITRMVQVASKAVAILDIPDAARESAALSARRSAAGGTEAYLARYAGLDHRYYDRDWLKQHLQAAGLTRITIADQMIDGYENGRHRFNAWGWLDSSH